MQDGHCFLSLRTVWEFVINLYHFLFMPTTLIYSNIWLSLQIIPILRSFTKIPLTGLVLIGKFFRKCVKSQEEDMFHKISVVATKILFTGMDIIDLRCIEIILFKFYRSLCSGLVRLDLFLYQLISKEV